MFWIEALSALLTPVIAVSAIILGVLNYRLAQKKRKDELFDRRYAFYKKVDTLWTSTGNGSAPEEQPYFEWDDMEPYAIEAAFLFDEEIADYLRNLVGEQYQGDPNVPDYELAQKFKPYLSFK